jgi:hypothetical protein
MAPSPSVSARAAAFASFRFCYSLFLKKNDLTLRFAVPATHALSVCTFAASGDVLEFGIAKGDGDKIKPGRITMFETTEQVALMRGLVLGTSLLIDDGLLEVKVTEIKSATEVLVVVVAGGVIKARKGVNVPDLMIDCSALPAKARLPAEREKNEDNYKKIGQQTHTQAPLFDSFFSFFSFGCVRLAALCLCTIYLPSYASVSYIRTLRTRSTCWRSTRPWTTFACPLRKKRATCRSSSTSWTGCKCRKRSGPTCAPRSKSPKP